MKKNIREEIAGLVKGRYKDEELPLVNLKVVSGHVVCRNCGKESGLFDILGNPNNYCGNCGVRLGHPFIAEPFEGGK